MHDIVCVRRGDYSPSPKATESHDSQSSNQLTIAIAFKYGLLLLAALTVPVILFKMFIIPMALLASLKLISLVNSALLGSLLLKYKWGHQYGHGHHGHEGHVAHGTGTMVNGAGTGVHNGAIMGGTGVHGTTGVVNGGATGTTMGNRIEIEYDTS